LKGRGFELRRKLPRFSAAATRSCWVTSRDLAVGFARIRAQLSGLPQSDLSTNRRSLRLSTPWTAP